MAGALPVARVFISHSSDDRFYVDTQIIPVLRSAGLETWYSETDIRGAEIWERAILQGLRDCEFFLLVITPAAAMSTWVRSETAWAIANRWGRIVPVLVQECELLDFHLRLPEIQFVDFRSPTTEAQGVLLRAFEASEPVPSLNPDPQPALGGSQSTVLAQLSAPRSHFHCGPWVPAEYFIGREEELAEARHLIESSQSFMVVGHPRAGKTSFCRKLQQEYDRSNNDLLSSYLNLQQCSVLTLETFLEHTILTIVGEIARKVFGCRYTDLKSSSPADGYTELTNDALFHSFVDIFRLVSQRTHKQGRTRPLHLDSHDFVHLTTDLLDIASARGRNRFLIFYDEANRLPVEISATLLLGVGETLNQTGVAGVYVASPEMEGRFEKLDQLFGARLPLGPFRSMDEMRQLLARYYFDDTTAVKDLPASSEALEALWKLSGGVPFLIQLIADRSFRVAIRQGSSILGSLHIEEGYRLALDERPGAFRAIV